MSANAPIDALVQEREQDRDTPTASTESVLGADPDSIERHGLLQTGCGWLSNTGVCRIVDRYERIDGTLGVRIENSTVRSGGSDPQRMRAATLLQRHESGRIELVDESTIDRIKRAHAYARACMQAGCGAVWTNGRLRDLRRDGESIGLPITIGATNPEEGED